MTTAIAPATPREVTSRWFVLRWLFDVVAWFVLLAAILIIVASVVVPRVFGATPYTVATGSMEPRYPPGTLMVMKPRPIDEIRMGDVITYQLESGKPVVATHRVVSIGSSLTGEKYLRTQGDANDAHDPKPVRPVQVRGELWYSIPYVGHASAVLTGSQRELIAKAVAAMLIAYALVMFGGAFRSRMSKAEGVSA